jgi:hypothetical protein
MKAHQYKDLIARSFEYHRPVSGQVARYEAIRSAGRELAQCIADACPQSAETARAIRDVRTAVMWANAAIACNETDAPDG